MRAKLGCIAAAAAAVIAQGASAQAADPTGRGQPPVAGAIDIADLGATIEEAVQSYQERITVSAGARASKLSDVPMTLSYLGGEEIEGTGQITLCDTIQLFPGLECRRGAMRQATISTRGLGFNFLSNRMLMLKDGRPTTDPWTGSFYADETMPLTNVKQVEVIRGPGSSLYGSNAFAGVINYITRGADDLIKPNETWGADARLLPGYDSTYRVQATAAAKRGDLKGLVNYYGYTTDGQPLLTDARRGIVDANEWSRAQQISGKVEYKWIKLDASFTDSNIAHPGGVPTAAVGNCGRCHYTPNDSQRMQDLSAGVTVDLAPQDWLAVQLKGYGTYKRRVVTTENLFSTTEIPVAANRSRLGADVRGTATLGGLSVIGGGDVKFDNVTNQNLLPILSHDDTKGTFYGVYTDVEYRPIPTLILGAGVRYDGTSMPKVLWQNSTSQLSPRASIVFHASPKVTLRTSYGHAFRAPTMTELGIFQEMYASTLQGNPYLKPETLDTGELAADFWPFGEVLRLTGTGFLTRAHDFINEEAVGAATAQFQNTGAGHMGGVEAEAAWTIQKLNTSVNLSYQYLRARDANGVQLPYAPEHRVQFRSHVALTKAAFVDFYGSFTAERFDPGFLIDGNGRVAGHLSLPSYLLVNGRIGWSISDNVTVSLLGTNLFNAKYEETIGFPTNGMRLFAELKVVR